MLDYSFHCVKIYSSSNGDYYCACNFDELPLNATDKQLASLRRKASLLGILAAAIQEYDLEITSASLLGAALAKDFMHGDLLTAELSNILGPGVPVQSFIHSSPLFQLKPSHLLGSPALHHS